MACNPRPAIFAAAPIPLALSSLVLAAAIPALAADPVAFRGLGFLTDSGGFTRAYGISADGSTVIGGSVAEDSFFWSYRWTEAGGMVPLPKTNEADVPQSQAHSISADGSVITGLEYNWTLSGTVGYRWTSSGGLTVLPYLAGFPGNNFGTADAISADGSVVAGSGPNPFRWTQGGGVQTIPLLAGDTMGFAHAISADGSIIVGCSGSMERAYRWTEAGGTQEIMVPGAEWSDATAISGDGSTIFGIFGTTTSSSKQSFLWTELGIVTLSALSIDEGTITQVAAASASGLWAVGESDGRAALWNTLTGEIWDLNDLVADQSAFEGWVLEGATGISADGRKIVGNGVDANGNAQGWIIDTEAIPEPSIPGLLALVPLGLTLYRRRG